MGARAQHAPAYRRMCRLLLQWRAAAGLTQRALGVRLRKPHSYVWKVETAERRIDPIELFEWCRACGVEPIDAVKDLGV